MQAADLVRAADAAGHRLALEVREFPQYEVPAKFYVTCSCGYRATVTRTRRTASEMGTRHLRRALSAPPDGLARRR